MEEPSDKFDPIVDPKTPQMNDEDSSDNSEVLQPEMLAKVMKKLTLNPRAKRSARHCRRQHQIENRPMENRSEKILREVQSAFPKRRVRTLLSVLKDPVARMKRFIRIEKKLGSPNGNEYEENKEPFRCLHFLPIPRVGSF